MLQDKLKNNFYYNPDTGEFIRKISNGRFKSGEIAGTLHNDGYIFIFFDHKKYPAHRLAYLYMTGNFPQKGLFIDHINQDRKDNRWKNLRLVTIRMNNMNRKNKSNHVYKSGKGWAVRFSINKKIHHFGYFKNKDDAIKKAKNIKKMLEADELNNIKNINKTPSNKINKKQNITQEELKKMLYYNPETGSWTWLIGGGKIKIGSEAGSKNKNRIFIGIKYKIYTSHRLAFLYMTGKFPEKIIDHINGNSLDNRWENLREISRSENQKNQKLRKDNKSGYPGIFYNKKINKWVVKGNCNKKLKELGSFKYLNDAIKIRKKFEEENEYHKNHGMR